MLLCLYLNIWPVEAQLYVLPCVRMGLYGTGIVSGGFSKRHSHAHGSAIGSNCEKKHMLAVDTLGPPGVAGGPKGVV